MESYEVQLKDFKNAEQELTGKERVFISQYNNTRATTIDEIRKPLAEQLNEKLSLFIGETLPDEKDDKTLYFKVTDTINISNNGPIKASPTMGLKEV